MLQPVASVMDDLVVALAELYLDTDVRDALPRLAQRIVGSGLPRHQVEQLWRREITPAVHWNLKSATGEWAGFDRRWLLAEVARRRGKSSLALDAWPLVGRVLHRLRAYGAEPEIPRRTVAGRAPAERARAGAWPACCGLAGAGAGVLLGRRRAVRAAHRRRAQPDAIAACCEPDRAPA